GPATGLEAFRIGGIGHQSRVEVILNARGRRELSEVLMVFPGRIDLKRIGRARKAEAGGRQCLLAGGTRYARISRVAAADQAVEEPVEILLPTGKALVVYRLA